LTRILARVRDRLAAGGFPGVADIEVDVYSLVSERPYTRKHGIGKVLDYCDFHY